MGVKRISLLCGVALVAQMAALQAIAAPAAPASAPVAADDSADQIIVTGTRDPAQTARSSISPITVVGNEQLQATGQPDLRDALTQLSPSITHPRIGNSTANIVSKVNLRTLSSNQTLILVNGKRRHVTSILADTPGIENGSTPVDLAFIPQSAIDHIEILEDGAAALYGSDAIAGVINIILKSDTHGLDASTTDGAYYKGDGFSTDNNVHWGTKLGAHGFLDVSAEYGHQDPANRSGIDSRVNLPVSRYFAIPETDRYVLGYNAGYEVSPGIRLYSFGTYGRRHGFSYQNYRLPTEAPALIPNGLNPLLMVHEHDYSATVGLKGDLGGWSWDISSTYGGNNDNNTEQDTINQTLYKATGATPMFFHLGGYSDTQWTNDASLRREVPVSFFSSPLNITVGGQFRRDGYKEKSGDPAGYYGAGVDGESTLPPSSVVNAHRYVKAGYVDVSTKIIPQWQVAVSGRYEDYTTSGHVLTGKASTRFDFNDKIAVRGTVSNGFRAPTMAEQFYSKIGVTSLGANGTLALGSPGARLLGAPDLKPERSMNYSASLLLNPLPRLHFTVDAYQIKITNRIVNAGTANGATAIAALLAQGVGVNPSATPSAVTVSYFTNAADTITRGIDFTGSYRLPLGGLGFIDFDVAANINKSKILKVNNNRFGNPELSIQGQAYLTTYFPRDKEIFGGNWQYGRLNLNVHEIRYGHLTTQRGYYSGPFANSITVFYPFYNEPKWQTNVELGYKFTDHFSASVGATNLFNAYPNKPPASTVFSNVANYEQVGQGLDVWGGSYFLTLRLKM